QLRAKADPEDQGKALATENAPAASLSPKDRSDHFTGSRGDGENTKLPLSEAPRLPSSLWKFLRLSQRAQSFAVGDDDLAPMGLKDPFALKRTHRQAALPPSRADEVGHLLVGDLEPDERPPARGHAILAAEAQEQLRQFGADVLEDELLHLVLHFAP